MLRRSRPSLVLKLRATKEVTKCGTTRRCRDHWWFRRLQIVWPCVCVCVLDSSGGSALGSWKEGDESVRPWLRLALGAQGSASSHIQCSWLRKCQNIAISTTEAKGVEAMRCPLSGGFDSLSGRFERTYLDAELAEPRSEAGHSRNHKPIRHRARADLRLKLGSRLVVRLGGGSSGDVGSIMGRLGIRVGRVCGRWDRSWPLLR